MSSGGRDKQLLWKRAHHDEDVDDEVRNETTEDELRKGDTDIAVRQREVAVSHCHEVRWR